MAVDLLQLGQHLGNLEARIGALEDLVHSLIGNGAMGSQPAEDPELAAVMREADDGGVDIPGVGKISMGTILGEALKKYGGKEGLFAALMKDPPAESAAPAVKTASDTKT